MRLLPSWCRNTALWLLLFCWPLLAHALQLTKEEQAWVEANPTIYLGSDFAWPPYDFVDSNGQHSGISADFMALIEAKTGLNIQIRSGVWSDIMQQMRAGELDGLACAMQTPERQQFLRFTAPYTRMPLAVVVQSVRGDIRSFADLKDKTVAVNQGSYLHEWFQREHPEIPLYLTSSNKDSLEAVSFSRADAYVGNVGVTTYLIKQSYLTNLKIVDKVDSLQTETSVAIAKDKPLLASIMQKALAAISEDEKQRIHQYWFDASRAEQIELSAAEKYWIRQNPKVRVGALSDWAPYDFIDKGKHQGIAAEYLALIAQRTGLKFEVQTAPWTQLLSKLETRDIDLLPAAYHTPERERFARVSEGYFDILDYFFVRRDLNVVSLSDLDGKTVAIPKGFAQAEQLRKHFPRIRILAVDSFSESVDAVLQGRADMLYEGYPAVAYALNRQGINDIVPFRSTRGLGLNSLHMLSRSDQPELASIIQKALHSISLHEHQMIYQRWVERYTFNELKKVALNLTPDEQRWLLGQRQINYSVVPMGMPYADSAAAGTGIVAEYLTATEAVLPLRFTPQTVVASGDSAQPEELIQEESVIVSYTDNPSLADAYRPIQPFFNAPLVILMRSRREFVNELGDIATTRIAIPQHYGIPEQLQAEYPDNRFVPLASPEDTLQALANGKVGAAVLSMPRAYALLQQMNLRDIHIVGKTHVNLALTLYVPKGDPVLHSLLDKALTRVEQTQGTLIAEKWSRLRFAKKTDYILIVEVAAVLLLIMAVVFYWNLKLSREISQRKVLEKALRQSQLQLLAVIDNVPLRILVTDPDGTVLLANAVVQRDFGLTEAEALQKNIADYYVNDADRAAIKAQLAREGQVHQKVVSMREANGSISNMMLSVLPIEYNSRMAYLSLSLDLSERIAMEQALKTAKEQAEAANAAKSEFLANMSHEIRTPMNAILGFTELLQEQVTEPRLQSFTQTIQNAGNTLLRLINDILDLSKIEAGKMELSHSASNVHELFREIADIFTINVGKKGIDLYVTTDPNIPEALLLDTTRLRQVLFNLLGNAVKFTDQGHVSLKARTLNYNEAQSKVDLQIEVQDTGMGIAPDQLDRIFDSFSQQRGQDSERFGGTGLGLSISQRLVELMAGEIHVESERGVGTTFTVVLRGVDIASVQAQKQLDQSLAFDASRVHFEPARVLVVDDVADNRALLLQNFSETSLSVIEAENGLVALEQLQTHAIDLVIMDIRMPQMDGYDCTREIKAHWPDLPVIALTASVMQDEFRQVSEANFDAYLRKPVLRNDLFQTLCRFLPHTMKQDVEVPVLTQASRLSREDLQVLRSQLQLQALPLFERAQRSNNMDTIAEFAKAVAQLSVEEKVPALDRYATLLLEAIDSFNIMAIKALLTEFDQAWQATTSPAFTT